MTTFIPHLVIFALFILGMTLWDRIVWQPRRRREAELAPRITLKEVQEFWASIEAASLPVARAMVRDRLPRSPQESRLGGAPLAIADEDVWPLSAVSGIPMAFLAQINFSEMPKIKGFPASGMIQFFSSFEWLEETNSCEVIVRWDESPTQTHCLEIPEIILNKGRRWFTGGWDFPLKMRKDGLPIKLDVHLALGNPFNWPFEEKDPIYENRLPENDEVRAILEGWEERSDQIVESYSIHWVGGQPAFVQEDIRQHYEEHRELDRVLFHLGSDELINIGDGGMINIMISQADLDKRQFEKAVLMWDCY